MYYPFISTSAGRLMAAAATLLLATAAHAMDQGQFQDARALFIQAQAGDTAATEKAADAFGALLRTEPDNPVLMAYAGASTAMRASTTMLPWKKMNYAEDGLAMIDKALAMLTPAHNAVLQNRTPAALEVRFVAASTFLAVPGFMNRGVRGATLLTEVLDSPLFAQAPLGFQGAVWLRSGKLAQADKRTDDARKYFNEVIKHNAPQADAARAQLSALPS
jgi:tetratricopeptide (TPR) repeat protein